MQLLQLRIFRYAVVGFIAFIIDAGVLYGLTAFAGVNYLFSAASGFMLGLTTVYLLSLRFVFADLKQRTNWTFTAFLGIGLIGLGLNEGIMWFFTEKLALYYMASKIVSVTVVFFWNYVARKKFCFEVKAANGQ